MTSSAKSNFDACDDAGGAGDRLASGRLSVSSIVFFVVAAAAPLVIIVSGGPFSMRVGGLGAPGAMLVAGVVLFLFACGFTAMSKYVRDAGAFYAYVSRGLNETFGGGTAVMTMAAYGVCVMGFMGYLGFFAAGTADAVLHIDLPWQLWSLAFAAIVALLGYCQVDIGAKVLGVLLALEVGVILILIVSVLARGGPQSPSAAPFSIDNVFLSTGSGTLFLLAFGAYLGFEGTAIYAEEAKSPERTIPYATYIAVGFLAIFYAFSYWVIIYGYGTDGAMAAAQGDDFLNMVFTQADRYAGGGLVTAMQLLIVTSMLATAIAFHNACSRYLFSLGRNGILPQALARTHPRMHSPHFASVVLSMVTFAGVIAAIVLKLDPYLQLGTWLYAAGVIGVVAAQAVCALAVVAFFLRDRRGHSALRVLVAPSLGFLGLVGALILMVSNFSYISGYTDMVPNLIMIGATPVCFVVGMVLIWNKSRVARADDVGRPLLRADEVQPAPLD
ncbi:APC family permease [Streptomyces sp. B21-101]|uniref:APC family permease n=1 Tax=Streptomyces sp. B21-101 TaxID=3039415 RepID=UPI002FEEBE61